MRFRAISRALFYGFAPWWLYESSPHYDCGYLSHLAMNLRVAWCWLSFSETAEDIAFEREVNG